MKNVLRKLLTASLLLLMVMGMGIFAEGNMLTAKAYYGESVGDLKQVNPSKNSITLTWTAAKDVGKYQIEIRGQGGYEIDGTTTACSYTISGLSSGREYDVRVTPYSKSGEEGYWESVYDAKTIPDKITGVTNYWNSYYKQITMNFDYIEAADNFVVTLYNSKNSKVKTKTISGYSSSAVFEKVGKEVYKTTITAYTTICGKKYATPTVTTYCVPEPEVKWKSCKLSAGKLKLKWTKIKGVTGYDIYISTKRNSGFKKVKSVKGSATGATISKFKGKKFARGKTHYIKVVLRKKVGKKTYKTQNVGYAWYF